MIKIISSKSIPYQDSCHIIQPLPTKENNLKDYHASGGEWDVADLVQLVRTGRGRTNTVEGHLPTLTTNSAKLWSKVSRF